MYLFEVGRWVFIEVVGKLVGKCWFWKNDFFFVELDLLYLVILL